MTTNLEPRHAKALRVAYENTTDSLQKRYLREALKRLGVTIDTKRARTKVYASPFLQKHTPSDALAAIIGHERRSRADLISELWRYIKKHKLQDTQNRRYVNCDEKLLAVFNKNQISLFEMAGLISKHIS